MRAAGSGPRGTVAARPAGGGCRGRGNAGESTARKTHRGNAKGNAGESRRTAHRDREVCWLPAHWRPASVLFWRGRGFGGACGRMQLQRRNELGRIRLTVAPHHSGRMVRLPKSLPLGICKHTSSLCLCVCVFLSRTQPLYLCVSLSLSPSGSLSPQMRVDRAQVQVDPKIQVQERTVSDRVYPVPRLMAIPVAPNFDKRLRADAMASEKQGG
jgi:hypothetical protein